MRAALRRDEWPRKQHHDGACLVDDPRASDPCRKSACARTARQRRRPRHPEKAHRPDQPVLRKPDWIRVKAPGSPQWAETQRIVKENRLVTVCEEAGCPNIGECWEKKHATFMIMGDTCTRACAFCNVKTGMPGALDPDEPRTRRRGRRQARPRAMSSSPRSTATISPTAAREHFAQVIRAIRGGEPRHDDRGPDAGLPAQGRRAGGGGRGAGPTCSTTIWRPCRRTT